MNALIFLIPLALGLGGAGLALFLWSLHSGQYDDLRGAADRILYEPDRPLPDPLPPSRAAAPRALASQPLLGPGMTFVKDMRLADRSAGTTSIHT